MESINEDNTQNIANNSPSTTKPSPHLELPWRTQDLSQKIHTTCSNVKQLLEETVSFPPTIKPELSEVISILERTKGLIKDYEELMERTASLKRDVDVELESLKDIDLLLEMDHMEFDTYQTPECPAESSTPPRVGDERGGGGAKEKEGGEGGGKGGGEGEEKEEKATPPSETELKGLVSS